MTIAKNNFFVGLLLENCYLVEKLNFWWEQKFDKDEVYWGENFS